MGAWSVSHWTTGEVPSNDFLSCFPEDSIDAVNKDSQNVPPVHTAGAAHQCHDLQEDTHSEEHMTRSQGILAGCPTPLLHFLHVAAKAHLHSSWAAGTKAFPCGPGSTEVTTDSKEIFHINGYQVARLTVYPACLPYPTLEILQTVADVKIMAVLGRKASDF